MLRELATVCTAFLLAGCQSTPKPADTQSQSDTRRQFVLVYLKSGPEYGKKSADENKTIFAGHMANIHRLADQGKLCIAGPFDHPTDSTWRGIFVMDVPDQARAAELVATDPGVVARVFSPEFIPMWASPQLRTTMELERKMLAEQQHTQAADKPPPNVRAYVMVTAEDGRAFEYMLSDEMRHRVIWCGRLGKPHEFEGIYVFDAEKVEELRAALGDTKGLATRIDSWWSSTCLTRLPKEAAATDRLRRTD